MKKALLSFILVAVLIIPAAQAVMTTFDAVADAEIDSHVNYRNNPLGSEPNFEIGTYPEEYAGEPNSYALIRWDISAIPCTDTVTSVTLEMTGQDYSNGPINVYMIDEGDWDEATVTWNSWQATTKSMTLIGQLVSAGPANVNGVTTFSSPGLLAWVRQLVVGTHANYGIYLEMATTERGNRDMFSSRETTWEYGHAPELIIEHGPAVPAGTMTLDAAGDTEIDQHVNYNNKNLGAEASMRIETRSTAYTNPVVSPQSWALIKWNVSGIHPTDVITGVTFQVQQADGGVGKIKVYAIDEGDWDEMTVTWNSWEDAGHSETLIGTIHSVAVSNGLTIYNAAALTNLVQKWVSGEQPNYGLLFKWDGNVGDGDTYLSRENTGGYIAPQLVVSHEPATPSITGQVAVDGYDGDLSLLTIHAELRQDGTVAASETVMPDSDGRFSIDDVDIGVYDIAIKVTTQLQKIIPSVTVLEDPTELGTISFDGGDVNGDGVVDVDDLNLMSGSWLSAE